MIRQPPRSTLSPYTTLSRSGIAGAGGKRLRSRAWFDNPANPDMTALYLERYLNFGLTAQELQSGLPIIGIAQTGSDLADRKSTRLNSSHSQISYAALCIPNK